MMPARRFLLLLALGLAPLAAPAQSNIAVELAEAKTRLLDAYQNGETDSSNRVKQLKEKITALEYVTANKAPTMVEPPRVISLDFPGGPAATLFDKINKDASSGLNIIGEKADLAIELPPFSLRNADGNSLAGALDGLLRQRGYVLQGSGYRPGAGLSGVFVLRKLAANEMSEVTFQSFQLANYLEHQTVDDIVGAIRAAWELDPTNPAGALRLKYHPATGILLVSCPARGLHVVQTVLNQLRKSDSAKPLRSDAVPGKK